MISFNRWLILYLGIGISFVLLVVIPREDFFTQSLSTTLIAVLCICHYLYKRYWKRLTIQADLLIAVNTLVMYLLPVFYFALYFKANPGLDPVGYRYGYAITSFAMLLGLTMFFLGYETRKPSVYFPSVKITENSPSRLSMVLFPLLVLMWGARFYLLSTGTYYQTFRSGYQGTPWGSILGVLSTYGLLINGAFFLIAFSEKEKRSRIVKFIMAAAVWGAELIWYLPAGSRGQVVTTILAPLFAYILVKKRVPKKVLAMIIIAGLPALCILGSYRYVAPSFYEMNEINLRHIPKAYLAAGGLSVKEKAFRHLADRFYDGKFLGYLLMNYSNDYDYELGGTYKEIPAVVIPRFIWTGKPLLSKSMNKWYSLVGSSAVPITVWGEAYINFSWFGIILIPYLLGLIMKGYDYLFIKRASKQYWVFVYLFSAILFLSFPAEGVVTWMSFFLRAIVFAFLLTEAHKFLTIVGRKV